MSDFLIEHELKVVSSLGEVPNSALPAVHRALASLPSEPEKPQQRPDKKCPFRGERYDDLCSFSCALYTGTGCGIVEHRMGTGVTCPFQNRQSCGDGCALYVGGGCALVGGKEQVRGK